MNIDQHINLKLKEAEELYTNILRQEEQVSNAKQQTIGRIAALKEMQDRLLQADRKEIEDTNTC